MQWDPYNVPILSEKAGKVKFHDIIEGVTMKQEMDETTGQEAMVVIEHKEDLHPQIIISDDNGEVGGQLSDSLRRAHRRGRRRQDRRRHAAWPRRRARRPRPRTSPAVCRAWPNCSRPAGPKDAAEISKIDGVVDFGASVRGKRCIVIKDPQTQAEEEHLIPIGKHVIVFKGDFVKKGQQLTEGPIDPHEILDVCGPQELQEHLVNEVQEVYRLQGVTINDKHIEIIVRQMLRKVRITEPGDTDVPLGRTGRQARRSKKRTSASRRWAASPPKPQPVLLGITKASLETESFLSAASFQDTTRVLTEAATRARWTTCAASRKTSSWATSSRRAPASTMHRKVHLKPLVEIEDVPEPAEPPAVAENPLLA